MQVDEGNTITTARADGLPTAAFRRMLRSSLMMNTFPFLAAGLIRVGSMRALVLCAGACFLAASLPSQLHAAPLLDARAQCGAAIVPDANVIYFNDSKAVRESGFYRAAQNRAAEVSPEVAARNAAKTAKMKPLLDLIKKDLNLLVGSAALKQLDITGKPDPKKTPFVIAMAFDRALTVADVQAAITKSNSPAGTVSEHAGYQVVSDPAPKDGPVLALALAPAGDSATTVFVGPMEALHAALDRLRSGQVVSLTDLPARAAASIEPGAQSWLFIAPPSNAMRAMSAMNKSGGNKGNTAVTAAWNALSGLSAIGMSISCGEAMKVRLQGNFASAEDAAAVRTFLENVAIPAAKIGAANKLEKVPGAVERLKSDTFGTGVGLNTLLDATDIGLVPPEALSFLGY